MISTTNTFKNAIKRDIREIKATVEVQYDNDDSKKIGAFAYEYGDSAMIERGSIHDYIGDPTKALNGIRTHVKYGFINDLPLDGSALLPSRSIFLEEANPFDGYISDWIWAGGEFHADYDSAGRPGYLSQNLYIEITPTEAITTKELTIYFKNGYPKNFDIVVGEETYEIKEEDHDTYFLKDDSFVMTEELTIETITLVLHDWSKLNVRPEISEIDFGFTRTYTEDDLVTMDINETINVINSETPTGTMTMEIVTNKEFDILNPDSYIKYMNSNVRVDTRMGVISENGPEYVNTGTFYINNWNNNEDGTVTIESKTIMDKFAEEDITTKNRSIIETAFNGQYLKNWLQTTYGSKYPLDLFEGITDYYAETNICIGEDKKLIDMLQYKALISNSIIKTDRYGYITFMPLYYEPVDEIKKELQENKAKITQKEKINQIKLIESSVGVNINGSYVGDLPHEKIQEVNLTLKETTEYVKLTYSGYKDPTVTQTGATSVNIISGVAGATDYRNYFNEIMILEVKGNVGANVQIQVNDIVDSSLCWIEDHEKTSMITNIQPEEPIVTIEIDSEEYGIQQGIKNNLQDLLEHQTDRQITMTTFGDPSLETGDVVEVETDYEPQKCMITNIALHFDGGLREDIEGVVINA